MNKPVLNISIGEPLKLLNTKLYDFANSRVGNVLPYCEFYHFDVLEAKVLFYPSKNWNLNPVALEEEDFYFQFNKLYRDKVNIETGAVQLHINLLYGLTTDSTGLLLKLEEMIGEVLSKQQINLNITLICFGESLNSQLHNYSSSWGKGLQTQSKNLHSLGKSFKASNLLNNLLILEDTNINGIALKLDQMDLIRFLFELNILTVYHHHEILNSFENQKAYGIGISTLYFDFAYVKGFLALQAFQHLIQQSNIKTHEDFHEGQILSIANKIVLDQNMFALCNELHETTPNLKIKTFVQHFTHQLIVFLKDTEDLTADHKLAVLAQLAHIDISTRPVSTLTVKDLEYESARYFIELSEEEHSYPNLKKQLQEIQECEQKLTAISSKIAELPEDKTTPNVKIEKDALDVEGNTYSTSRTKVNWQQGYEQVATPSTPLDAVDLRGNFLRNLVPDENFQPEISAINHIYHYHLRLTGLNKEVDLSRLKEDINNNLGNKDQYTFEEILDFYKTHGVRLFNKENPNEPSTPYRLQKIKMLNSLDDIKSILSEGQLVYTHIKCFHSHCHLFRSKSGILLFPKSGEVEKGDFFYHVVILCGYDSKGYFIAQSPWGEQFGDNGNLYIPQEYLMEEDYTGEKFVFSQIENCKSAFNNFDKQPQPFFNLSDKQTQKDYHRNEWRIINLKKSILENQYQEDKHAYEEFLKHIQNPVNRNSLKESYTTKSTQQQAQLQNAQFQRERKQQEANETAKKKKILNKSLLIGGSVGLAAGAVLLALGLIPFAIPLAIVGLGSIAYPLTLGKNKEEEIISTTFAASTPATSPTQPQTKPIELDLEEFPIREKMVESFPTIQKAIERIYFRFKQFTENIYSTESSWVQRMIDEGLKTSGPFYSLVQDEKLIEYYTSHCSLKFGEKSLYDYIDFTKNNSYFENIDLLKEDIKDILNPNYVDIETKFDLLEYLQGKSYPYLPQPRKLEEHSSYVERYSLPAFNQTAVINANAEMGRYLSYPGKNHDFEDKINGHLKITPLYKDYRFNLNTLSLLQFKEIRSLENIVASNHSSS